MQDFKKVKSTKDIYWTINQVNLKTMSCGLYSAKDFFSYFFTKSLLRYKGINIKVNLHFY